MEKHFDDISKVLRMRERGIITDSEAMQFIYQLAAEGITDIITENERQKAIAAVITNSIVKAVENLI